MGNAAASKRWPYGPPPQARDFIASWVDIGKPAVEAAGDKPEGRLERIEAEVVRLSLANLMTFPWIAEAVAANRLVLQGYWFDVHTGVLANVGPERARAGGLRGRARPQTHGATSETFASSELRIVMRSSMISI